MFQSISFGALKTSTLQTISRFQWVLGLVLGRSILMVWRIESQHQSPGYRDVLDKLILVLLLACPLMIGISLAAERTSSRFRSKLLGFLALSVILLTYYFFGINAKPSLIDYYRFGILFLAAHLLVAYAPFLNYRESNGFWQFNKALFLQFLNATLYAVTLYIGLMVAVQTVRFLFNIEYLFEIEADVAVLILSFFHSVFFLSKIPTDLAALDLETAYPKGLKIFTQYVLLPLEIVYLVILYAYTGKILLEWSLPSGGVAYLVLAFSVAGIFALLLLYPLRQVLTERWIVLFSRRFYLALLPLLILLFVGILRRINDYGITENRYIVVTLALWLAALALYFLFSRRKEIIWIPISLSLICVFLVLGPWNIFEVSEKSQLKTFQRLVVNHQLLNTEGVITHQATLPADDYEQLLSIVDYFRDRDTTVLASYFPQPTDNKLASRYDQHQYLLKKIANQNTPFQEFTYSVGPKALMDIEGFSTLLSFNTSIDVPLETEGWKITMHQNKLLVARQGQQVLTCDLPQKIQSLNQTYGDENNMVPPSQLTFNGVWRGHPIRVSIESIHQSNQKQIIASGYLLY
ncbi:uncharacterized protein DUF4153 [Dyadobacter jejuensis]|uniref:Uncharacterized protein DUF4153 n=1 Tax=Dyadobacter jejuensis TaxID=1082580 RepID=A0A316AFH2_9BACT|nr:DUF4153 domain-containing protein [Dyadobacter jejuensis]PWJ56535.1 uncharacterized protein DUF4153 [Dyadobacter jejuensis]